MSFNIFCLLLPAWTLIYLLPLPVAGQPSLEKEATVIRAGLLFDSENGTFLPEQDILVRDGKIEAVGRNLTAPDSARVIDLRSYTILPGLIDAHTHLFYLEDPKSDLTTDGIRAIVNEGTALRALRAAARGRTFLEAGITTVRDLGNAGEFGDVALKRAIDEGSTEGPRMLVSGPGLAPEGGQFPGLLKKYRAIAEAEYRVIRGVDDAMAAVRENVTYGADVIKIYSDNAPNPTLLSIEEMRAIVEEAHRLNVKVTAHAVHNMSIWNAVQAGVDAIEHGYSIEDSTLSLMAERGVVLVPTNLDSLSIVRYIELTDQSFSSEQISQFLTSQRSHLRRAVEAGVTIASGSDNYVDFKVPQGQAAKRVLFAYAEAGIPPVQVLQAATVNAARLLGRESQIGVIKEDAFADIIAVEGNPETNISALENVRFVMKNGIIYVE